MRHDSMFELPLSTKSLAGRVSAGFCMACSLRQVAVKAYTGKIAFSPSSISNNLQGLASSLLK